MKFSSILLYVFYFLSALSVLKVESCPAICSCKWKSGKQTVECVDKGLSAIPPDIEPGTQVLVFNGNNIRSLPRLVFVDRNLLNLQRINLANCNLARIDNTAFSQLSNLVDLDLSYNSLTDIPAGALKHAPALRQLNLAGNLITTIPSHSFTNIPGLVHLDISDSKLHTVSPLAFQSLTLLETLQIQENSLKELPETVIRSLESSHGVHVHENPWICDCRALPLWRLLVERRIPHPESPVCNSPRRMAGMKFDSLEEMDFACPPKIRPVISVVRGVAGEHATVTCPVEGHPPPEVLWFIEDRPVVNGSILGLGPQRVYIVNGGHQNKVSHLVITGAQEADSGQIRCIAVNPAGRATANFTLAVTMKAVFPEPFNTGHIAAIAIGILILAIVVFIVIFLLFSRSRPTASPTPGKDRSPPASYAASPTEPNPIQKPPRLTELSTSSSTDPDLISEAEKSARGNGAFGNGYLPNGRVMPSVSDAGDYTRMEGDSLYPSSLWDTQPTVAPVIHEHFNPGFMTHESPLHASHMQRIGAPDPQEFDPQLFGYPSDYGLPIPEVGEEYGINRLDSTLTSEDDKHSYNSRHELSQINQKSLANPYQTPHIYSMLNSSNGSPAHMRIHENKLAAEDVTLQDMGSTSSTSEIGGGGGTSSSSAERPWLPSGGGGDFGVGGPPSMGVPVLPPLPNSTLHRLKARDSPDEGYQEGTEV